MLELDHTSLHGSLTDPVLGSISFLNEVMSRYPDAISFAPGAPNLAHLDHTDLSRFTTGYLDHLTGERGMDAARARRLLHEYGPSRGLINDLVAGALRTDYGIDVPDSAVVITVGAQEAMLLSLRALFGTPADLLAVVTPCFTGIIGAARLLDIGVVAVPEDGDGVDAEQLLAQCQAARSRGRRVRALYVAPDFANPSGTLLPLDRRLRLLDLAEQEDLVILEDTVYGFTALAGEHLPTLKALDRAGRVVQVGSFAKTCLPGARVGYAVADQRIRVADGSTRLLADALADIKTMVTVNTSALSQAVIGGMLLEHGGSLSALGAARAPVYRRNLAALLDALDRRLSGLGGQVSWNRPTGGFFVRLRLPVPADVKLLDVSAADFGVLWTPMSLFHLDGSERDEIRLSCSYLEPDRIDEGAARLAEFVHSIAA
ncbi:MAG TPA: PLP-dependent aminotransferase family protein [Actinocrinis sp.]|uniref:aminotransferase-like domain-containing protein n=1 Tax=Actinocrinis sp. TaxID=1920516 RepID=UPI002DDD4C24|nr:PLP-dependent aminotransferase family protein [Actinocrinis sp.]HEV2344054.1 PLP-dependent aminotransferase family protein [Actinocrinis sp.]